MVLGLFKPKAIEKASAALSNVVGPKSEGNVKTLGSSNPFDKNQVSDNLNDLHQPPNKEPVFTGNPEDQVIIMDIDETMVAGDKQPINDSYAEKINAMGDRKVSIIPKEKTDGLDFDIKYVLRPGTEELLKYLTNKGHKIIASSRNYRLYAEALQKHDPVLSKYVSAVLGREDLLSNINKDFNKYPHHPDNYGFFKKLGCFFYTYFWYAPKFCFKKFFSFFTGANIRWNPNCGILGKYPPNMIELLKARGNHKLDNYKTPRILVDNLFSKELGDCKRSGDFVAINPNVRRNGNYTETEFHNPDDPEPKDENGEYLWVKKVIEGIERGWEAQYKETTSSEPNKL